MTEDRNGPYQRLDAWQAAYDVIAGLFERQGRQYDPSEYRQQAQP